MLRARRARAREITVEHCEHLLSCLSLSTPLRYHKTITLLLQYVTRFSMLCTVHTEI